MTILSPPFALGAAGQVLSGRNLRLSLGSAFRPAASGVQGISGVLYGPANTMGELTLPSNTQLTVQPFRAVIQNTEDVTSGQYVVTNDAAVTLAVTAQNATQFRRSLVLITVDDSQTAGVASSATTDRARPPYLLDGALAASAGAAALPAVPPNSLALGELLIPPTGQAVTLTPYNPRTTARGGILPVLADASTVSGHAGAPGTALGQYRDHPNSGMERWDGTRWSTPSPLGLWGNDIYSNTYTWAMGGFQNPPSMAGRSVVVPPGRQLEVEVSFGMVQLGASTNGYLQLYLQGGIEDGIKWSTAAAGIAVPAKLAGHYANSTNADLTVSWSVAGAMTSGAITLTAGTDGVVKMRHRVS